MKNKLIFLNDDEIQVLINREILVIDGFDEPQTVLIPASTPQEAIAWCETNLAPGHPAFEQLKEFGTKEG